MLQVYVTEPINYFLNLITHLIFNYFTKKQGMGSFLSFTHHVPYSALSLCSYWGSYMTLTSGWPCSTRQRWWKYLVRFVFKFLWLFPVVHFGKLYIFLTHTIREQAARSVWLWVCKQLNGCRKPIYVFHVWSRLARNRTCVKLTCWSAVQSEHTENQTMPCMSVYRLHHISHTVYAILGQPI